MKTNIIYQGDCLEVMKTFPDDCIDMCMTSPPYWGLRDYGDKGQYGLENSPEEYIEKMTNVFSQVKRILKKEGTLWLNIGDTYSGSGKGFGSEPDPKFLSGGRERTIRPMKLNIKDKCLCMIPERLAWSLIQDGWILRNKIIWYKPNSMPSSVTDRLSNKYEFIYLFSQQQKYYFDLDSIREKCKWDGNWGNPSQKFKKEKMISDHNLENHPLGKNPGDVIRTPSETRTMGAIIGTGGAVKVPGGKGWTGHPPGGENALKKDQRWNPEEGKNPGDFMEINTTQMAEAHFAVFPEKLCEKPIKAGSPENGIVLDPFSGAGTTLFVAKELRRKYIGIEINPEYIKISEERLRQKVFDFPL